MSRLVRWFLWLASLLGGSNDPAAARDYFTAEDVARNLAAKTFDKSFSLSNSYDSAAEMAVQAYQKYGGTDPVFVAQIQYWTAQ